MYKKLLVSISLMLFSGSLMAQNNSTASDDDHHHVISPGGLFIEPILQTSRGDSTIKTSQLPFVSQDTSGTTDGYGVGLKLGVHLSEILFLGVDGRYAKTEVKDSTYETAKGDEYNYGPTAGIQMPILGLRLMGTYVAGGQYDPAAGASGVDLRFRDPTGWRFGAGIHILSVSLNLEYEDLTYNTTDIQSFGSLPINTASSVDYENKGYMLSLSFPIEL